MTYFNQLSPAELERLALLSEELGEAQQAIGKILRHGYESSHPHKPGPTNRRALEREIGDVAHAVEMLVAAGDLSQGRIDAHCDAKAERVKPYLHHQAEG